MSQTHTPYQRQAIDTDGSDICVAAGAGSGKTGVLVERFLRIVTMSRDGTLPTERRAGVDEILVITFTDKATREMKSRIVDRLIERGMRDERRKVETAYISTIHGFCSRLLQENPFDAGIDPHFTVLEEPQARRLLRQCVEAAIADENADGEIMALAADVQHLRIQGAETEDPIAALGGCVESVLGKVRSTGHRRGAIDRILAEGTAGAALRAEEVAWSALSPLLEGVRECLRAIQAAHAELTGMAKATSEALLAYASGVQTGAGLMQTFRSLMALRTALRKVRSRNPARTGAEMEMEQQMSRLKAVCDDADFLIGAALPDSDEALRFCIRMWRLVSAAWTRYEAEKRKRSKLDNEDLQAECVRLLEECPEVRDRYRRQLRYLMIDEFQDTNALQMRLVELLHCRTSSETTPRNYLFVVGDVQQSIYGFRSADPLLFRGLERRYREGAEGVHIGLSVNFRSRPEILHLIGRIFQQVWRDADTPFVPLEPGAMFDPRTGPSIELLLTQDLMRYDYLAIEPEGIARRIRAIVESEELRITSHSDRRHGAPVRYGDIAVLLRQLTDIQKYEDAFTRAGVPFFVVGGGRGYYARQEIRDILNILITIDTPMNDVALMASLRSPIAGVEIDTLYRIVEHAKDAAGRAPAGASEPLPLYIALQELALSDTLPATEREKLRCFAATIDSLRAQEDRMPVGHLLERLITATAYDARLLCRPNGRRRLANVRKLLQMANSEAVPGVRAFIRRLQDLERLSDREGDAPTEEEDADVVRFHTIHGAKGLEFPVVILGDLSRPLEHQEHGLFVCDPHTLALGTRMLGEPDIPYRAIDRMRQQAERQEAERLLYVAMTRAREYLILCGNLGRNRGLNWGDRLFQQLGVLTLPAEPTVETRIGGVQTRISPLAHYLNAEAYNPASKQTPKEQYIQDLLSSMTAGAPIPDA